MVLLLLFRKGEVCDAFYLELIGATKRTTSINKTSDHLQKTNTIKLLIRSGAENGTTSIKLKREQFINKTQSNSRISHAN